MPFKMMNPLKKMDTTAMKTVQKSAMKLKDLNNDGETTKADLLIKKGVYNKDGSPKKKASGVNYMNESKSPAKVGEGGAIIKSLSKAFEYDKGIDKRGFSSFERSLLKEGETDEYSRKSPQYKKAKAKLDAYNKKMSETGATSGGTGEAVVTAGSGSRTEGGTSTLKPENKKESSTTTNTTDKKTTAEGDRFSKAYEIAKKKYPEAYGKMTLAEYTAEAKKQIANRKETGKYIGGTKKLTEAEKKAAEQEKANNQAKTDVEMKQSDVDKKNAEDKKKFEEAKKKAAAAAAAAEEAKKNKKLTPKEKRKAERNIKAQEKANKKIRKGGGTEIEVDKKNTTATAADRRKLKQGAKRLEQKLSLAQKEIDRKNKKKKEDKKGKDKKEKDNTSKTSKSFI
jgi:hypothetical protein